MQQEPFKVQVWEKVAALVTAAFGLVAALAWNELIKAVIAQWVPEGSGLAAQLVYALFVTLVAVLASVWVARAVTRARR
jgi:hypothetical protein